MTHTETGKTQVSRRTLAKGAAWSVPVIATAAAAPAASASTACTPGEAKSYSTAALTYTCQTAADAQPIPNLGLGAWTATITTSLPSTIGPNCPIPASTITAHVVTSTTASQAMSIIGANNIESGTSAASYSVAGAADSGTRTGNLTVTGTPIEVVSGQAITTDASGSATSEVAGPSGNVVITVGDFNVSLVTDSTSFPNQNVVCTLDAGQDATLATIPITA